MAISPSPNILILRASGTILAGRRRHYGRHGGEGPQQRTLHADIAQLGHGIVLVGRRQELFVGVELLASGLDGRQGRVAGQCQDEGAVGRDDDVEASRRPDTGPLPGGQQAALQVAGGALDLAPVTHAVIPQFDDGALAGGGRLRLHQGGANGKSQDCSTLHVSTVTPGAAAGRAARRTPGLNTPFRKYNMRIPQTLIATAPWRGARWARL
jgi:hypothetical protein